MRRSRVVALVALIFASPAFGQELTADEWALEIAPEFVTPSPDALFPDTLNIPRPQDARLVADCRQYYADEMDLMSEQQAADFDQSVICFYLDTPEDQAAFRVLLQSLNDQGFEDQSGTYVQSAMRIFCNLEYTLVAGIKAKFVPRDVMIDDGGQRRLVDIEGGGRLVHTSMMMLASDTPCEGS